MELKEGMYVRTALKGISKIIAHEHYWINKEEYNYIVTDNGFIHEISSISKTSNNIIDLIEVGDYVNGYKVTHRMKSLLGFEDGQDGDWYLSNENIKSIVTKEQFESMSYKISLEG